MAVLGTKIRIPDAGREQVQRRRLNDRLGAGEQSRPRLVLGSAPPGFGKTTVLTSIVNDLDGHEEQAVVVLDDYHVIESPEVHRAVSFLLDHLPPHAGLAIATRADPPLPLPRLRARGELVELRAADLRFTPSETDAFLTEVMGLHLTPDQTSALETRTEGWVAGLQLAGLALRDLDDAAGFVASFTGSHRFVLDYLGDEVLRRQEPHMRRFLLDTAVLRELTGPLCGAVTGRDDGEATLDLLDRTNPPARPDRSLGTCLSCRRSGIRVRNRAQRHTAQMSQAHGHRHGHGQAHHDGHGHGGGVMMRSRGYDLVGTLLFGGRRRRAYRELVLRSGAQPGDRVLDVGCGTGYLTALLAEAVGPNGEAVGVDPSEAMVSQASEVRSGAGARYLVGFAESLALADASFDVVTSSLALHHIDEDQRQAAAAEMARVLRPGGRVLVADFRPPSGRLGQWFVKNVVGLGMASNPVDTIRPILAGAGFVGLSSGDVKPWLHWVSGTKPS